jgi:MraZ protein
MLRGNYQATVDEKGRVKIPADFLVHLHKLGTKYYVTSLTGDRTHVYPMKKWEEIERKLAKLSSHNRTREKFLERTNYYGQAVEMDGQGRILIPPVLRESAEMRGDVDVQGQLTYLVIWNHARFLEHMKQNALTAEDEKSLDGVGV